jgi:hypothetical protein
MALFFLEKFTQRLGRLIAAGLPYDPYDAAKGPFLW